MLGVMLKSALAQRLRPNFDDDRDADTFLLRLERYGADLVESLENVYGDQTNALLDELFEVITLVQTRKAKQVPIVLCGTDYWKRLLNFELLIEEGVISPEDLALFQYADDAQTAWDMVKAFYRL